MGMTEQAKGARQGPQRSVHVRATDGEQGAESVAGERLMDEIDGLLDEIDEVLESNAEEFVRNYVQKGGQ